MDRVFSPAVRFTASEEGLRLTFILKFYLCHHHFWLGTTSVFFWVSRVFEKGKGAALEEDRMTLDSEARTGATPLSAEPK